MRKGQEAKRVPCCALPPGRGGPGGPQQETADAGEPRVVWPPPRGHLLPDAPSTQPPWSPDSGGFSLPGPWSPGGPAHVHPPCEEVPSQTLPEWPEYAPHLLPARSRLTQAHPGLLPWREKGRMWGRQARASQVRGLYPPRRSRTQAGGRKEEWGGGLGSRRTPFWKAAASRTAQEGPASVRTHLGSPSRQSPVRARASGLRSSCPGGQPSRQTKALLTAAGVRAPGLFLECRTTFSRNRRDALIQEGGLGEMKTSSLDMN